MWFSCQQTLTAEHAVTTAVGAHNAGPYRLHLMKPGKGQGAEPLMVPLPGARPPSPPPSALTCSAVNLCSAKASQRRHRIAQATTWGVEALCFISSHPYFHNPNVPAHMQTSGLLRKVSPFTSQWLSVATPGLLLAAAWWARWMSVLASVPAWSDPIRKSAGIERCF